MYITAAAATVLPVLVVAMTVSSSSLSPSDTMNGVLKSFPRRQNDEIIEESLKDAVSLIAKHGYHAEEHRVITADDYVLTMHRIPWGNAGDVGSSSRVPVLLMHGMLCSSADWLFLGPGRALAYILVDAGYDVWMGNARGNYYSRKHLTLDPDRSKKFWNFSWNEIGLYDLPAMIDHVLNATGQPSLQYIGHSQGTTSFFVMTSNMPEYNAKVRSMQAFAPVAFMSHQRSIVIQFMANEMETLQQLSDTLNIYEILPKSPLNTILAHTLCREGSAFQMLCINIVALFCGYNPSQLNKTMLPIYMSHTPAGIAFKQLLHYGQGIRSGKFRRYDHGPTANLVEYGAREPPDYDLKSVTAPVYLHISDNDLLSDLRDVQKLHTRLGNSMGQFKVPMRTFNHLDYLWGNDAINLLYRKVMKFMKNH